MEQAKKTLLVASIIYTVIGFIVMIIALVAFITSHQIVSHDLYSGESKAWGTFLAMILFIFSLPSIALGLWGLKNYKNPKRGTTFMALGATAGILQIYIREICLFFTIDYTSATLFHWWRAHE